MKQLTGWIAAAVMGVLMGIRWWYSLRQVDRGDKNDEAASKSMRWIINTLRDEIDYVRKQNEELRDRVGLQTLRIAHLEAVAAAAGLSP